MIPKTARLITWGGQLPEAGHYLRTPSDSVYLVIGVVPNTRPNPKSVAKLHLLKFSQEDKSDIPEDAIIHYFKWG